MTRKWNIVNGKSNANYDAGNEIIYNTDVLKSNLFDYDGAYILVRGDITVTAVPATQVSFKNCASFTKCITKIDRTTIDNGCWRVSLVILMYNLINYSSNYSETRGSLWFYSKDEATNFNNNIGNTYKFKSFEYKAKVLGSTVAQPALNEANGILKKTTIALSLKYLSNFWRSLKIPLINCKIESKLK